MWTFCIFLCKIFSKIIQPAQFDYVILHISVQVFHHTNGNMFLPLCWINHQETNDISVLSEIYMR